MQAALGSKFIEKWHATAAYIAFTLQLFYLIQEKTSFNNPLQCLLQNKLCSVLTEITYLKSEWSFTILTDAMSSLNCHDTACNVQINK